MKPDVYIETDNPHLRPLGRIEGLIRSADFRQELETVPVADAYITRRIPVSTEIVLTLEVQVLGGIAGEIGDLPHHPSDIIHCWGHMHHCAGYPGDCDDDSAPCGARAVEDGLCQVHRAWYEVTT